VVYISLQAKRDELGAVASLPHYTNITKQIVCNRCRRRGGGVGLATRLHISAEVRNAWNCISAPQCVLMSCWLVKLRMRLHGVVDHRDEFIVAFY